MNKKRIKQIAGWLLLIALWEIAAKYFHNSILLPTVSETVQSLWNLCRTPVFYAYVLSTVLRVGIGFLVSLVLASLCCCIGILYPGWLDILRPFQVLISSIPNITYIFLAILWCGSERSVTVILTMILFPVLLNSLSSTLLEHTALNDVCRLYRETAWTKLSMYSTSVLRLPILEASKTALAMGFKVGVMAEILSSVRSGMGRGMQYAKLNLDTPTLFAYTVCIILISYLIQGCIQIYMHHISKRV